MWVKENNKELFDECEVVAYLDSLSNGVVVLDGPSGCGKTTIIKSIKQTGKEVFSAEFVNNVIDEAARSKVNHYQIAELWLSKGEIVCLEDIDYMLTGKDATTQFMKCLIEELSGNRLFVLTGINIVERVPVLVEDLTTEYFVWNDDNSCIEDPLSSNTKRFLTRREGHEFLEKMRAFGTEFRKAIKELEEKSNEIAEDKEMNDSEREK